MTKKTYSHKQIEKKWAKRWFAQKIYKAKDFSKKPKYYVLDMFPYPSGAGLHVGHIEGYTATDIISRYKRMNGFEVLHPMGWDAFGLPTENYAIKTNQPPEKVTEENVNTFKSQIIRSGMGIDWGRELNTSSQDYYKWTQWIFLLLYKNGLAYKALSQVNWCPSCQTVIANEQVVNGKCERCDSSVESKKIEQWFFRITDYADRLIKDLEKVKWPESTKTNQINWIGKTSGVNIKFPLEKKPGHITVFTTRPETIYGTTFIALAPEYPNIGDFVISGQKKEVNRYLNRIIPQSLVDRKRGIHTKTGVFTGTYAINPSTMKRVPIWISDYVLTEHGTGAIMGVPAHDERDRNFADLKKIPVVSVFNKNDRLMIGPYKGEKIHTAVPKIKRDLGKLVKETTMYKLKDWLVSRERYWGAPIPIVYCDTCGEQPVPEEQLPVLLPNDIQDYQPTGKPPLAKSESFMNTKCPRCGGNAIREAKTLDTFVDSSWYFLRFADAKNLSRFANRNKLDYWLPVDLYIGGAEHTHGHLLYSRFITKVLFDQGYLGVDEPFAQLKHPGIILGEDQRKMSKRWGNVVQPEQIAEEFGSDTLRLYEMFMGPLEQSKPWSHRSIIGVRRFIDKVWNMQSYVSDKQPTTEDLRLDNDLVKKVTNSIEKGKLNVAVSHFMIHVNKYREKGTISRRSLETFLLCFSPFAPFISEELWSAIGNEFSIHSQTWPKFNKTQDTQMEQTIPVDIDGKFRGSLVISKKTNLNESKLLQIAIRDEKLLKYINRNKIAKLIYIPHRVFSIVHEK